jgi:hypothetical protein
VITGKAHWEDIRELIEKETGPVRAVEEISEGRNSEVSVIVRTDDDATFVKGRRADHAQAWTQDRERAVNRFVRHVAPQLKWSSRDGAWDLNGFEYIPGVSADYSPGSPHLPQVLETLLRLQKTPCPGIEVKQAAQRWASYTSTPELLAGTCLLHTDWNPSNVLVNSRAYLVDWAWPTKGAAWIDPACWTVWLIASGHSPRSAESWAARVPSWHRAPPGALDEFARVQALMWAGIAADSAETWTGNLARASRQWAAHRDTPPVPTGAAE